jgi:hypothetical protein
MGYLEKSPGVKISRKARAEWLSLKPGAHEDYVSWERFDAIRAMVRSKRNSRLPVSIRGYQEQAPDRR